MRAIADYAMMADATYRKVQYELDVGFVNRQIDEVALLFPTPEMLGEFRERAAAKHSPLEHFNSVSRDTMVRIDRQTEGARPESFEVRFEFFHVLDRPYRIEAMTVLSGHAPLHAAAIRGQNPNARKPVIIHASYKVPALEDKATFVDLYAEEGTLGAEVGTREASYQNSYGAFSYWRSSPFGRCLLKPRVNLRD